MKLQLPKGMRDINPEDKILRDNIIKELTKTFEVYGFNPLETPIVERFDILANKFGAGESSDAMKETFKLKDQGKREFIPESKMLRAESLYRLKRNFKEQLNLYFFMKKIIVSDFGRREEYRKHVTMLSHITEDEVVEIDVPQVMEYFEKTKIFINDVEEYIG